MTFKEAQNFVEKWQPILAPEWAIKVEDGPSPHWAPSEHVAATQTSGIYLRATLHVNLVTAADTSDEDARQTLLHELLHLTVADLEKAAVEPTKALSHDACRIAQETIEGYVERTADRLATAIEEVTR